MTAAGAPDVRGAAMTDAVTPDVLGAALTAAALGAAMPMEDAHPLAVQQP